MVATFGYYHADISNTEMASNDTEDIENKKATADGQQENQPLHSSLIDVIPVIEEHLTIDRSLIETGKVRIIKKVHEEKVVVDAPALHEELKVERVLLNQYVETPPPAVRYEGETMIIPVLREVVETRLVLVEELHITKRNIRSETSQEVVLRKEEVQVEHTHHTNTERNHISDEPE